MSAPLPERIAMARAEGRCTGSLFFSIFGGVWLTLALAYSHHFHWYNIVLVIATTLCYVAMALRMKRHIGDRAQGAYPQAEKQANDNRFLLINASTYGTVFLLFAVLPRLNASNYVFPAFVFVVGLHFLPMPELYRHRSNTVVGLLMMAWAIACVALFHRNGELEAACVTAGAGLLLWVSAAVALQTAMRLIESVDGAGQLYT